MYPRPEGYASLPVYFCFCFQNFTLRAFFARLKPSLLLSFCGIQYRACRGGFFFGGNPGQNLKEGNRKKTITPGLTASYKNPIPERKEKKSSGAHSRVATLIQPSFISPRGLTETTVRIWGALNRIHTRLSYHGEWVCCCVLSHQLKGKSVPTIFFKR